MDAANLPAKQRLPQAWSRFVDFMLPAEVFSISGVNILFQSDDAKLRHLLQQHWGPLMLPPAKAKAISAAFQFSTNSLPALPRLRRWHKFSNDHFLFLSDGRRYLVTGYMYE